MRTSNGALRCYSQIHRVEMAGLGTYVSKRVQVVVCQLELLEGDELPHPMRARGGRVRVNVEPPGHGGLCLPGHGPESQQHSRTVTSCAHTPAVDTGASCEMFYEKEVKKKLRTNYGLSINVLNQQKLVFTNADIINIIHEKN